MPIGPEATARQIVRRDDNAAQRLRDADELLRRRNAERGTIRREQERKMLEFARGAVDGTLDKPVSQVLAACTHSFGLDYERYVAPLEGIMQGLQPGTLVGFSYHIAALASIAAIGIVDEVSLHCQGNAEPEDGRIVWAPERSDTALKEFPDAQVNLERVMYGTGFYLRIALQDGRYLKGECNHPDKELRVATKHVCLIDAWSLDLGMFPRMHAFGEDERVLEPVGGRGGPYALSWGEPWVYRNCGVRDHRCLESNLGYLVEEDGKVGRVEHMVLQR